MDLCILHVDDQLLVIDKPEGMHTAPLHAGETGTLLDAVIEQYPEVERVPGIKPVEPGLLHRLDKGTSGVVVIARSVHAFTTLARQFESGDVRKEYLAVCVPGPAVRSTRLSVSSRFAPLGPGRTKVQMVMSYEHRARVLKAASPDTYVTEAEIAERGAGGCLVRCTITRGFRHQVRVHLAHLGLPIVGDPLYGVPVPPGFGERMYLHASAVELHHPADGRPLRFESDLPNEFPPLLAAA
ncbi:MAG: RluA family pseudouridine synthase, partial [Spirochaetes bacterium]|nr:RluA family pseudouridine synthase [Spirochaetota bacterium]